MACMLIWSKANGAQGLIQAIYGDTYRFFQDSDKANAIVIRCPNLTEDDLNAVRDRLENSDGTFTDRFKVRLDILSQATLLPGREYEYTGDRVPTAKNLIMEPIS